MNTKWRTIGEIVAVLSVVVSLLFVGYELRVARLEAGSEVFSNASDTTISVLAFISEYPDIWRKGCLDEELTPDEKIVFQKLVSAYGNRNFTAWSRTNLGLTDGNPDRFAQAQAINRYRFPGFNTMELNTRRAGNPNFVLGGGAWNDAVDRIYDGLVESNMPRNIDVAFCGRM